MASRIAGLNLGRLLQTIRCDQVNFTQCVLPAYMIVTGEMAVGILVTCVPTFGPVFFPGRHESNTGYKYHSKERSSDYAHKSSRTPLYQLTTSSYDDNNIELDRALQAGNSYQARASRGSGHENSSSVAANEIGVREDLSIVETRSSPKSFQTAA